MPPEDNTGTGTGTGTEDNSNSGGNTDNRSRSSVPEVFSREYVHELREENKSLRLSARGHEAEATKQKTAAEAATQAAQAKETEIQNAANERIIRTEVRAAARAAGIADPDFIKLLDLAPVKLKDDGEVDIPADFFEKVKAAKPHFFGAQGSSSPHTPPGGGGGDTPKQAKDMTDAEYRAEKAKLTRR